MAPYYPTKWVRRNEVAIRKNGVSAVTVGDLLDPLQHNLRIPHYQRPYSWEPATALQLVDDVSDAHTDPDRAQVPYVLGAVILHQSGDHMDVVDGQQRLLTLRMVLAILDPSNRLDLPTVADNAVSRVWASCRRRLTSLSNDERLSFGLFVRERCQLVRVVTDDVDEAFRVFDSQNYRGMPLAPHDLLKAHHLREMRDETPAMKAAVVETWESAKDHDLARLFSTYLYRIARWSRGESAPGFTPHDIHMFKGISPHALLSPTARYHLAAQAAMPMLSAWGATNALSDRDAGRSRFQLDAPLKAGRPFFEMVTFMLKELKQLAKQAFAGELGAFSIYDLDALKSANVLEERQSKSRYRYVSELYLAAMLYYTNRFGEGELEQAKEQLFKWAYALRAELLRVQFRSIDNLGRGEESAASAFGLLRNTTSGRAVNELSTSGKPHLDGHEVELVEILSGWAAT
jgi:hypothetical protein